MAPSHVPTEHLPLQGQSIYADPAYENLFPVSHFGAQQWNGVPLTHSGLASDSAANQTWHPSTYAQQPYSNQLNQQYTSQVPVNRSPSPYQYGQFNNHGAVANYGHGVVDPSLGVDPSAMRQQQQSPYQLNLQSAPAQTQTQTSTVTPQALQQSLPVQNPRPATSSFQIPKTTAELFAQRAPPSLAKPVKNPEYDVPKGRKSGGFVIADQAALIKATKSNALNKLVTLGSEPLHFASNRTALPLFTPRQSVKDLRKLGAGNKKSLAKKKSTQLLSPGKTLKQDVSDSESYDDSSDEDSEYSEDEEDEPSPLPDKRPDEMHEATRYDIIKAAWFPRRSQPSSEKIKASLRDVWDILNTIQKRWRGDSRAVTDAEEQKKSKDLPVLKSRVASSRDLMQSALQAALQYAHPDVLYHMGQVKPFLYMCYLFLANRVKVKDYDGALPTAIYEMLVRCIGTLTTELLEETKVLKALNSLKKNVEKDKHKALIQQVLEGAAAGSKKVKASSPPGESAAESKLGKRPATQSPSKPSTDPPAAKKPRSTEPLANGEKKPSTAIASRGSAPGKAVPAPQKRPGEKPTPAPAKARGTQVANKPSTLFASLNAASKKPGPGAAAIPTKPAPKPAGGTQEKKTPAAPASKPAFSFAETMAQLLKPKEEESAAPAKSEKQSPPETPAEKAKRLRKESRRHLRVAFKPDAALVQIKYFHHDPEEESGHDENFVRDAGDIGGEGRMFKQHKDMIDEDDDEEELTYRPWKEPSLVDFSRIDPEERKRNYEPYGGGENKPNCPEKEANIQHETSTLMVYYSHPSDIPSSPREPLEQHNQPSASATVIQFGTPPDQVLNRVPKSAMPAATPDFSSLESIIKQLAVSKPEVCQPAVAAPAPMAYAPSPAPAPAAAPVDLASILSALNAQNQAQTTAPPPAPVAIPPMPPAGSAPPAFDYNALFAAISQNAAGSTYAPPVSGWPTLPAGFPQQAQPDSAAVFQSPPQPQPEQHARGGHKRQREIGNDNDNGKGHGSSKRNKFDRERSHNKPHKVVMCKFFSKGLCNKGDDCTYIHDTNV